MPLASFLRTIRRRYRASFLLNFVKTNTQISILKSLIDNRLYKNEPFTYKCGPRLSGVILFLLSDLKPHNLYEGNNFCSINFSSSGF